jgi:hypothetical protein
VGHWIQETTTGENIVKLEDWTEARLRAFVQSIVDQSPKKSELPPAAECKPGDVLTWDGIRWVPKAPGGGAA